MRPTTLRDARKHGYLPSVTTVMNVAAKPGLERWKIEQAVLSALTLPRGEGEPDEVFIARVLEDSKEQARKAAGLGTLLHEQIERSFNGTADESWLGYVNPVRAWLDERFPHTQWRAERSFSCPEGYGGKVDLYSEQDRIVVDFKTKDLGPDDKVKAWPEHGIQLAAYAHGLALDAWEDKTPERWNLFVSTREPGIVRGFQHDPEDYEDDLNKFFALLQFWKLERGYSPRWT